MIRKTIKGGDFKSQMVGELVFDQVPKEGSFNPVTSDGVAKATSGGSGDTPIKDLIPDDASEENKLVDQLQLYKELHRITNGGTMLVGAKVGDILYVDPTNGDKYFLDSSVYPFAKATEDGLKSVGVVYNVEGRKVYVTHQDELDVLQFTNGWLFKLSGIKTNGTDANVISLQKFNGTNSTGISVGTYDDTDNKPTSLAEFVEGFDAYLREKQTTEGAVTYNWHCEIMPDADGVSSAFIVVDSNTDYRQVSVNPIASSASGASAALYMWDFANQTTNRNNILRADGVTTFACIWNKERFKQYNNNVNSPTDSLSSGGIFSQSNFTASNCPTLYAAYDGDYDKYLDAMFIKWPSDSGSQAAYNGTGKDITNTLAVHTHKNLDGEDIYTFAACRYAYERAFAVTLDNGITSEMIGEGAWFLPDMVQNLLLLENMKTDGTDKVNKAFTDIGQPARSITVSRWTCSRTGAASSWLFGSLGYMSYPDFSFSNVSRFSIVAILDFS